MTRQDYELIARVIREMRKAREREPGAMPTLSELSDRLALELSYGNPEFDRARFLRACGFPRPY